MVGKSTKNKTIVMTIIIVLIVIFILLIISNLISNKKEKQPTIKNDKTTILELFYNFPESKNIYYVSENLYSERSIGPTIYQIDILAELTEEGYNRFINKIDSQDVEELEIKINPNNLQYNFKEVKNIQILESKDIEDASVSKIYLDSDKKTIYVIALGGN